MYVIFNEMKKVFNYTVYIFAIIGFILVCGFFAVKFGLTNEKGIIDNQRGMFLKENKATTTSLKLNSNTNLDSRRSLPSSTIGGGNDKSPIWTKSSEWSVIRDAVTRDKDDINKASDLLGINPRLIISDLTVEQLRLFYTNRELFKTVFAPLKILGNQSQFSWGVMGLKQETAIQIENNLKDKNSPFYLGPSYVNLLDFKTDNHDEERFMRITDEKSRYYSYLYTAIYIKQIEAQWKNAGYDISHQPEILSTLFNIGFTHSTPNADPHSGGAPIEIDGKIYSFGAIAGEFYNSNELLKEFPR